MSFARSTGRSRRWLEVPYSTWLCFRRLALMQDTCQARLFTCTSLRSSTSNLETRSFSSQPFLVHGMVHLVVEKGWANTTGELDQTKKDLRSCQHLI